jgi:hypothetical protein
MVLVVLLIDVLSWLEGNWAASAAPTDVDYGFGDVSAMDGCGMPPPPKCQ